MLSGGLAVLPCLMDEIEKGDESLLWMVESVKQGRILNFNKDRLSTETATRASSQNWWRNNKEKWLVIESGKK